MNLLWQWFKRFFKRDDLKELSVSYQKIALSAEYPKAWPIIWYGPKVAIVLFLTGVGLGLWAFFYVLERYPDEFWKPVAGAVGAGIASILTTTTRALMKRKNK